MLTVWVQKKKSKSREKEEKTEWGGKKKRRTRPELNRWPRELQSLALPLSYESFRMKSLEEVHESSQSPLVSGKAKKWFHPGSNRGPSLRKSDVITNYTMKPSCHSVGIEWSRGRKCSGVCVSCVCVRKKDAWGKKWFHPESNWGPKNQNLICCPYTMEPFR